jgi:hypothetical protein
VFGFGLLACFCSCLWCVRLGGWPIMLHVQRSKRDA